MRAGRLLYADVVALEVFDAKNALDVVGRSLSELVAPREACRIAPLVGDLGRSAWCAVTLTGCGGAGARVELRLEPEEPRTRQRVVFCRAVRDGHGKYEESEGHDQMVRSKREMPVTVLVCDDEARLATLTAGLLEEYGFEPLTTGSGDDALRIVNASEPRVDVLLLDVNLTDGLSADELLSAMAARPMGPKVILTSGLAEEDVPPELRQHAQVAGYLAKPYSVEQLIDMIDVALVGAPVSSTRRRRP